MTKSRNVVFALLVAAGATASAAGAGAAAPVPVVRTMPVASPASGSFASVACFTHDSCLTVGYAYTGPVAPIAAAWDGSSWSAVATPSTGTSQSDLVGLACVAPTDCTAVGYTYQNATQHYGALVEHWDGGAWSIVPSPNPGAAGSLLFGVACPTASSCLAVGTMRSSETADQPLVERWDGSAWSVESGLGAPRHVDLNAVTCLDVDDCVVVGQRRLPHSQNFATYAMKWDGVAWTTMPTPAIDAPQAILRSVACTSIDSCTAVGFTLVGSSDRTLVERWNGSRWRVVPAPSPGSQTSVFYAVSCPAVNRCVAAGTTLVGNVYHSLIEVSLGNDWSVIDTPSPSKFDNDFEGVTCLRVNRCVAVGESDLDPFAVRTRPPV